MAKVTVIIPVYNGERYLDQCIKSVLKQTLKDIEILCVDDGSTDFSARIIKEFALKDKRIRLFQQENQGAGLAKNDGLKKAEGKYVVFLDADDYYLDADALEKMFTACEEQHVLVCASLRKAIVHGEEREDELFPDISKKETNKILNYLDFQMDYNYQSYMFDRKFLLENEFVFPVYRRYEDPVFLPKVLFKAKTFMIADTYLYCYRMPEAITRFNPSNTYDLLKGIEENFLFSMKHGLSKLFKMTLCRLEYEYLNIILKNIPDDNLDILSLLLRLNKTVRKQINIENYIIRPLRAVALRSCEYEKGLLKRIYKRKRIAIYGAGFFGKIFFSYLKGIKWEGKVETFIVSRIDGNCMPIENIPIISLDEFGKREDIYILVAVGESIQKQIKEYLDQKEYRNYELLNEFFLSMVAYEINNS